MAVRTGTGYKSTHTSSLTELLLADFSSDFVLSSMALITTALGRRAEVSHNMKKNVPQFPQDKTPTNLRKGTDLTLSMTCEYTEGTSEDMTTCPCKSVPRKKERMVVNGGWGQSSGVLL